MGFLGLAIAALVIGASVASARWLVSRLFGVRGSFREMVNLGAERGRPLLAYARAIGSIAAIYLGCVLLFVPGFAGGRTVIDETSMRANVLKDGPAARAGMLDGDRIVSVNEEKVTDWAQLKKLVAAHPNETIAVEIERGAERKTLSVTTVGPKMMVLAYAHHESLSGGQVLGASFAAPYEVVRSVVRGLARSFDEHPELSGPVGISREVEAAAQEGSGTFFRFLGALASYQGLLAAVILMAVAFFTSFAAKRTLPTSGNSS